MNPAGIPAFYGAFAQDVAIAEVRPPVGGRVAVGKFKLLRPIKLLDMSVMPYGFHNESIFSARYDDARNKVSFLRRLHRRVSRPVLPSDETIAYLPTQAVAAYVSNVMKLDGVIYGSLQIGAEGDLYDPVSRDKCNVALFGKAARVLGAEPDRSALDDEEFPPLTASSFGPFPGSTPARGNPSDSNIPAVPVEGNIEAPPLVEGVEAAAPTGVPTAAAPAVIGREPVILQVAEQPATANSPSAKTDIEFGLSIEAKVELFDIKSVLVGTEQVYFHERGGEVHLSDYSSNDDDE